VHEQIKQSKSSPTRKDRNLHKRGGVYYVRAMVNGKRYFRSLSTSDKELAGMRARAFIKAAQGERFEALEQSKLRKDYATLRDVIGIYRRAAATRGIKDRTVGDYINSLAIIVHALHAGSIEELSTCVLSRDLVEAYVESVIPDSSGDALKRDRARRSARSTLRQARAVFSRWAMDAYGDLKFPDLTRSPAPLAMDGYTPHCRR